MKRAADIVARLLEADDDLADFDAKADAIEHAPPPSEYWEIYVGEEDYEENQNPDGYSVFLKLPEFSGLPVNYHVPPDNPVSHRVRDAAIADGSLNANEIDDIRYVVKISEKDYHDATWGRQTVG